MKAKRVLVTGVVAATLVLGLAACGLKSGGAADPNQPLTVMADVTPHSQLLKKAEELGLLGDVKLKITEISGAVDPNQLVKSGDIDANFFQHKPFLSDWNAKNGGNLITAGGIHLEPLGLYSKKVGKVEELPSGASIAIPQDPTNMARALFLLQDAGLITMNVKPDDPKLDYSQISTKNVSGNPKNIQFLEIDRPQLAATLDDPKVSMSIINGNYALEAGLAPEKDAKHLEKAENNPYVNYVVTRPELQNDPRIKKLTEALASQQIKDYIKTTYKGAVLPAQ
ncbi:MetQ/NlpA family ABC transporter substrate-binding protein [Dermatophilus congolensis]|uniref:Lipoprotein n=1 Tax=Dermatophilus congolensis TaxID=1863 RepID=A0A239V5S3_9MICO|nr:MetQ/NlpA family ABC transporter substrate-binding protein [Dermatophilus congolensis]MBO3130289.1 ABC transporter substrate-binding protein [Dermatophilus congolensis]MBO3131080.1 ABC transporter substrate-binding protein [Dermatophilus congolensis]MBO3134760.1 ABC transporter substrate-binding protein [Dermatophilus congolensis]MBO3136996.1 ABC transporter substrate-binding protein [Dermatophilus congolensis]MBO3139241.1 ABC transporter substrate-binding protein [Dermatophilus congolensis